METTAQPFFFPQNNEVGTASLQAGCFDCAESAEVSDELKPRPGVSIPRVHTGSAKTDTGREEPGPLCSL